MEAYTALQLDIMRESDTLQTLHITENIISYIDSIHSLDTAEVPIAFKPLTKEEVNEAVVQAVAEQFTERIGPVKKLDTIPVYGANRRILYYFVPHPDHLEILYSIPHS